MDWVRDYDFMLNLFPLSPLSPTTCIRDGFLTHHSGRIVGNVIIIIFLYGLGRLTCSSIDGLPLFNGASAIPSFLGYVGEGVFRESGVVHSFEVVDPVLFVFESHVLYSRDL